MISPEIERCIVKFLNKSAESKDLDLLADWIKNPTNETIFKNYIKTHYAITIGMSDLDSEEIKRKLLGTIRKEKSFFYNPQVRSVLKYAALFILFLGGGYFFQTFLSTNKQSGIILPEKEAITLQLEDGTTKIISEKGTHQITDNEGNKVGVQKGSQLVYETNVALKELSYNTLTVPYGKRFGITLSDGTHVFLNSGTSIKYPVQFIKGKERKVFLTGEAFFDVVKDSSQAFVINAEELKVQVLGTKFNMANYPEDDESEVVLVEGLVSLKTLTEDKKEDVPISPGYRGTFNKLDKVISSQKVNTAIYTSWMKGNIVFRNAPFDNIIQKLERHYNVTIINNNEALANESFNATIEVDNETIEKVFDYFNKVYEIKYEIVNNKIVIHP